MIRAVSLVVVLGTVAGCVPSQTGSLMGQGALGGGAVGAGIGAVFGGRTGALIGGLAGAAVGAGVGAVLGNEQQSYASSEQALAQRTMQAQQAAAAMRQEALLAERAAGRSSAGLSALMQQVSAGAALSGNAQLRWNQARAGPGPCDTGAGIGAEDGAVPGLRNRPASEGKPEHGGAGDTAGSVE